MKSANYSKLDSSTGFIKENIKVDDNDIIVGKVVISKKNNVEIDNSAYLKRNESGFVDKVYSNMGNDNQKYCKIRISYNKTKFIYYIFNYIFIVFFKFCDCYGFRGWSKKFNFRSSYISICSI